MRLPSHAVVYTGCILIVVIFLFFSCGGIENPRLAGTWLLTTETGGGLDVGDGTYTMSYSTEITVGERTTYFYAGEGVIGGVTYKVSVEQLFGATGFDFSLYLSDDLSTKATNSIKMTGNLSGSSSASGNYEGRGTYVDFETGSFFTRKLE